MLVSIVPISDLIGDGGVSLFSEAYAKGSGGDHSGGGGGKHLGHQKGSGKHDDGQHSGVTGGHSIEDKVFRQGGKSTGSAGKHTEDDGHSIDDKIFHDGGEDHTDKDHDDMEHADTDHSDSDHSEGKGKGPKFKGGR
jgi:hypothetical protein